MEKGSAGWISISGNECNIHVSDKHRTLHSLLPHCYLILTLGLPSLYSKDWTCLEVFGMLEFWACSECQMTFLSGFTCDLHFLVMALNNWMSVMSSLSLNEFFCLPKTWLTQNNAVIATFPFALGHMKTDCCAATWTINVSIILFHRFFVCSFEMLFSISFYFQRFYHCRWGRYTCENTKNNCATVYLW